jgi:quercetin dioxygenase-like cupin family protein
MITTEIEKSKTQILIEMIDYVPNSVVAKSILRKTTGNVSIVALDTGETIAEKISPFDSFIQVLEGVAEITIDNNPNILRKGQVIVVPAHTTSVLVANERFKMISTVIKSGYEGSSI